MAADRVRLYDMDCKYAREYRAATEAEWTRYMAWLLARWCRKCVEHGDG